MVIAWLSVFKEDLEDGREQLPDEDVVATNECEGMHGNIYTKPRNN